jgi:hypothetical protein
MPMMVPSMASVPPVHRQDHEPSGTAESTLAEHAPKVGLGAGVVALVMVEDGSDALRDLHREISVPRGACN